MNCWSMFRQVRIRIEHRVNITRGMDHANDVNSVCKRLVENHVPSKGLAAQSWRQFIATSPHIGLSCQQTKFAIEPINPCICLSDAVFRDEAPNLGNVGAGKRPTNNACHVYGLLEPALPWRRTRPSCLTCSGLQSDAGPLFSPARMS